MKITSNYHNEYLSKYKGLVHKEWGKVEYLDEHSSRYVTPKSLLAIINRDVVGGLSYIWHPKPEQNDLGLWVNTVYVIPEYRKKGIGTKLLQSAMQAYGKENELFVYTQVPKFYYKFGWSLVSNKESDYICFC